MSSLRPLAISTQHFKILVESHSHCPGIARAKFNRFHDELYIKNIIFYNVVIYSLEEIKRSKEN